MSAAINYLHTVPVAPIVTDALAEAPRNNISYFEAAPEQRLRRALDKINDLQAEVRVLRDELSHAERAASQYERLLKNALVREQELKALVGKHLA
jgi:uncharacterized protein YlxW (UPF0749 family)